MKRVAIIYMVLLGTLVTLLGTGHLHVLLEAIGRLPSGDKLFHFLLAGTLALLVNMAFRSSGATSVIGTIVPGSVLVILMATLDEFSHRLLSSRTWSIEDLLANYLGIFCIGVLPLLGYCWFAGRRSESPASVS